MDARDLLLPSVKKDLYRKRVDAYFNQKGNSDSHSLQIDRAIGDEFFKLGMKENKEFIKDSIFGQLFQ